MYLSYYTRDTSVRPSMKQTHPVPKNISRFLQCKNSSLVLHVIIILAWKEDKGFVVEILICLPEISRLLLLKTSNNSAQEATFKAIRYQILLENNIL